MKRYIKSATYSDLVKWTNKLNDVDKDKVENYIRYLYPRATSEDPDGKSTEELFNNLNWPGDDSEYKESWRKQVIDFAKDLAQGKDKKGKSSKGDQVRIEVIGEKYERYVSGGSFRKIFKGADLLDALSRMCDGLLLYISSEEIEEDELDVNQILERIEESNGDGCDYIISIRNLNTGEDLLECEYADYDDDSYDYED